MKYYQKSLVTLTLLVLGIQSYADVLQTSVGANHSTPKVINQTENATTSQSVEINPYGKLSDVNQDQAAVIGIDFDQNPFIYGSGYHDSESNLEYMGARYYSADTGRFMAQDGYDLINRYNYANANPIMYVDPDGHMPLLPNDAWGWVSFGLSVLVGSVIAAPLAGVLSAPTQAIWFKRFIAGAAAGASASAATAAVVELTIKGVQCLVDRKHEFNFDFNTIWEAAALGALTGGLMSSLVEKNMGGPPLRDYDNERLPTDDSLSSYGNHSILSQVGDNLSSEEIYSILPKGEIARSLLPVQDFITMDGFPSDTQLVYGHSVRNNQYHVASLPYLDSEQGNYICPLCRSPSITQYRVI